MVGNDNIGIDKLILQKIFNKKISFLTVSQILGISRVINELGEEEFSKGNESKIIKKFAQKTYVRTRIIIDECSMIDTSTFKLLCNIKCPIIFIGDYCQLPPVNEILSPTFALETDISAIVIQLSKVERCKNEITNIANKLRDKIYNIISDFNILKSDPIRELIIYNKCFNKWIDSYVENIKSRQADILTASTTLSVNTISKYQYDTMALGWTNKCCNFINRKIRELLFIDIDDIDEKFIIKGDKLLVKNSYNKYMSRINPSTIVYVSKITEMVYVPLTFSEWCKVLSMLDTIENNKKTELTKDTNQLVEIDFDNIFISNINTSNQTQPYTDIPIAKKQVAKTITDYFQEIPLENTSDSGVHGGPCADEIERQIAQSNANEKLRMRGLFYVYHNLASVLLEGTYDFSDEVSVKYNNILEASTLFNIKNLPREIKQITYMDWHSKVARELFGLQNDKIHCKKCAFFAKKFSERQYKTTCYMQDMENATQNLRLSVYQCDLVMLSINGKNVFKNIPVLDNSNQVNIESLEVIKNIIKNSYEVKVVLTKQEERELTNINRNMGEEESLDINTSVKMDENMSIDKNAAKQIYITMSQMFGHYLSHVLTSAYLDVDYGYALTVHKSQGSTYHDVYMEYGNITSNRKDSEKYKLLYTALTRCANNLHIYY